jgi:phenylacetate-CoA ligase
MSLYRAVFAYAIQPAIDLLRGTDIARTYQRYRRNEHRPVSELATQRADALGRILRHAATTVPYYRQFFEAAGGFDDAQEPLQALTSLPLLEKRAVREHGDLLRSGRPRGSVWENRTGGSTGEPLRTWFDASERTAATAAFWRGLAWAGVQPGEPICVLVGGTLGLSKPALGQRVQNILARRLLLPAFTLSRATLPEFVSALRRSRPAVIHGYASTLFLLARLCEEAGITDLTFRSAVTTAEVLEPRYREAIERRFGCRVFDLYGSAEVNSIAMQCEAGTYHTTDEKVILECLPDGEGRERAVVTTLTNFAMPLLRYVSGDALIPGGGPCPCGRSLSSIGGVAGRTFDFIRTSTGDLISGEFFPHLFRNFRGFDYYQIVQADRRAVEVRVVKNGQCNDAEVTLLRAKLHEYLGSTMRIEIREVAEIPRTPAGKLRVTVSEIDE